MGKTALISGISGQTGALLAHRLLHHDYKVIGGSRDKNGTDWWRLEKLGILDDVELTSLAPSDFHSVLSTITQTAPDEIYYLGGQTSVALSFAQPFEAFESIAGSTLNFLEAIRVTGSPARFFNAASTDCFGNQSGRVLDENSPMKPMSPYGVAKAASFWTTVNYRDSFGIPASNAILTNHESPLRGKGFVTQKIISTLKEKLRRPSVTLTLGDTSIRRDWLWAPEAVEAIHLINTHPETGDYIVGSGNSYSLHQFVETVCRHLGINVDDAYEIDKTLLRPGEIPSVELNVTKIHSHLGWRSIVDLDQLVSNLCES